MPRKIELELASHERKALFRASRYVYRTDINGNSEFADNLCDGFDDGGLWNPCRLQVGVVEKPDSYADSYYGLLYVLNRGIREYPEFSHTLEMVKDRAKYIEKRTIEKTSIKLPPYFTKDGYYGPDWREKRLEAIDRDGEA